MENIISFSGGQTSGYMLRRLMDENPTDFDKRFCVVFENTGKEHDATLDFVNEVQSRWGVHVTWLEYTRVAASWLAPELVPEGRKRANLIKAAERGEDIHWYQIVNYENAARDKTPNGPLISY